MTSNVLYSRMPVSARNTLAAMADLSTALLSQLVKGPATPPPQFTIAGPDNISESALTRGEPRITDPSATNTVLVLCPAGNGQRYTCLQAPLLSYGYISSLSQPSRREPNLTTSAPASWPRLFLSPSQALPEQQTVLGSKAVTSTPSRRPSSSHSF
jgi:hypothetical protein